MKNVMKRVAAFVMVAFASVNASYGQGAVGIEAASSELATFIDPIGNFALVLGAIVGLIGGIRVYIKWNSGDQDVQKAIMGWFGSCIFLVTIGIVIKAFFGV